MSNPSKLTKLLKTETSQMPVSECSENKMNNLELNVSETNNNNKCK